MKNNKTNIRLALIAKITEQIKNFRFYIRVEKNQKHYFNALPEGTYCLSGAHLPTDKGLLYYHHNNALRPLLTESGDLLRYPEMSGLTYSNGTWK